MKNLSHIDTEKLEKLPKHDKKLRDWDYYDRRPGNFPWRHAQRFLESRVGQNWDDVVSEFTKATWIPMEHRNYHKLMDMVETHTFTKDGKLYYFSRWFSTPGLNDNFKPIEPGYSEILYVHPVTKKLCLQQAEGKEQRRKRWHGEKPIEFIVLPSYNQLQKIDGIWYRFWLSENPKKMEWGKYSTVDCNHPFSYGDIKDYRLKIGEKKHYSEDDGEYYYSMLYRTIPAPKVLRKQLNSKELKQYVLKNDPKPIKYGRLK